MDESACSCCQSQHIKPPCPTNGKLGWLLLVPFSFPTSKGSGEVGYLQSQVTW